MECGKGDIKEKDKDREMRVGIIDKENQKRKKERTRKKRKREGHPFYNCFAVSRFACFVVFFLCKKKEQTAVGERHPGGIVQPEYRNSSTTTGYDWMEMAGRAR